MDLYLVFTNITIYYIDGNLHRPAYKTPAVSI